jgi:uncharacterized protein
MPIRRRVAFFTSIVDRNDLASIYQLGQFYEDGKIEGKGIADAVNLFRKGATLGDGISQDKFGLLFYEGKGLPHDYRQAVYWFKEAAYQGYNGAFGSLCQVYMEAKAVHPNDIERYKWCDLAIAKMDHGELKDFAIEAIHRLAARMTDAEINKANRAERPYSSLLEQ